MGRRREESKQRFAEVITWKQRFEEGIITKTEYKKFLKEKFGGNVRRFN